MPRPAHLVILLAAACLFVTFAVVGDGSCRATVPSDPGGPGGSGGPGGTGGGSTGDPKVPPVVSALDYLPPDPVRDGSVDYTTGLQAAIDAARGKILILPDFPVRVSRASGVTHCLIARGPVSIQGTPESVLVETGGGVQILRCEDVSPLRLRDFRLRGRGGRGHGLGHGILQVTGGSDVTIEGVCAEDSDADGIVVANASGVSVRGCRVTRTSKSGIYLSHCTGGSIADNVVTDGVGHVTAGGELVGAGFQISSCSGVVCSGNVVLGGVGIGILLDANSTGFEPQGCVLAANRIEGVSNPVNPQVSCGIRCTNSAAVTTTQTLVQGNSIRNCGTYGIYVENHGGSTVAGNTVVESERSGIVVGTLQGLHLLDNTVRNSDVSGYGGQAAVYLLNGASGVVARGNVLRDSPAFASSHAREGIEDDSSGGGHSLEPCITHATQAPIAGRWARGDLVYNTRPQFGSYVGWVCTVAGTPGVWAPFGRIE